jgi:hypothetical protein
MLSKWFDLLVTAANGKKEKLTDQWHLKVVAHSQFQKMMALAYIFLCFSCILYVKILYVWLPVAVSLMDFLAHTNRILTRFP